MPVYSDDYRITIWLDAERVTWKFPVDDPSLTIHEVIDLHEGYAQRTRFIQDLERKKIDYRFAFCPDLQPPPPPAPAPPKKEKLPFQALVSENMI